MNAEDAEKLFYSPVDLCPAMPPAPGAIERAVALLASAKKPAIVIGKGAAYARVEEQLKTLVDKTGIPYYPMSMAKGVLPDNGPLSAISCRSTIDCNRPIAAPVVGDLASSLEALTEGIARAGMNMDPTWVPGLQKESEAKNAKFKGRLADNSSAMPMNHWTALGAIKPVLESNPDVILVNEGANTLDDTRDSIDMSLPRHRIDCATWAIMGMGMGSAIGAAVATGKSVVAIEGDSAFGFSGMDFSTICRFKLPVTVVIFNNGGIYNGIGVNMGTDGDPAPTTLDVRARYDKLGDAFGAATYYVTTPQELTDALTKAIASKAPALIDVQLGADSGKESGHIGYLNPTPLENITV